MNEKKKKKIKRSKLTPSLLLSDRLIGNYLHRPHLEYHYFLPPRRPTRTRRTTLSDWDYISLEPRVIIMIPLSLGCINRCQVVSDVEVHRYLRLIHSIWDNWMPSKKRPRGNR